MRYIIIICIYFLYSVGYVNSKNFEKCSSNNNSFEIDECLKKLKSKLMNKNEVLEHIESVLKSKIVLVKRNLIK